MGLSIWQILIIVLLVVILFGRGKISDLMGDVARGITSFKKGLKEDDDEASDDAEDDTTPKALEADAAPTIEGERADDREKA